MKVKTSYGIGSLSGKRENTVFYTLPNCNFVIMRSKPDKIEEAQQHQDFRDIGSRLKAIKPSQGFKDDFKIYTALYKGLPEAMSTVSNWYNLYNKLLWDMQKSGLVELTLITRELIYSQNLPCKNVKAAVDAGLLPEVLNYQNLVQGI